MMLVMTVLGGTCIYKCNIKVKMFLYMFNLFYVYT